MRWTYYLNVLCAIASTQHLSLAHILRRKNRCAYLFSLQQFCEKHRLISVCVFQKSLGIVIPGDFCCVLKALFLGRWTKLTEISWLQALGENFAVRISAAATQQMILIC